MFVSLSTYRDLESSWQKLYAERNKLYAEADENLRELTQVEAERDAYHRRLAESEAGRSDLLAVIEGLRESVKRLEAELIEARNVAGHNAATVSRVKDALWGDKP